MLKHLLSVRALMFASIAALGCSVTGCDFGNKTNETGHTPTEEGVIQEGDTRDDDSGAPADTAAMDAFR